MTLKGLCILTVILLIIENISTAQIVNIESARMQSDTTGWIGGAGAGITLAKNVDKIFIVNTDVHLQHKTQRDLWLILVSSNLLKAGNEKFVNNTFLHFSYNHKLNDWLRWEAFTQWQNNSVTQIDSRFLIGTGLRFKILSTRLVRFYAATLAMYEREKERTSPVIKHDDMRSSNYASFTITPRDNIEIISTTFFQPLFKQFSDYRILNQSSLKVKATRHFALSLRYNYLHDRFPGGTAPKTTYTFSTGIEFDF
jgi:hypothetical protein